MFCRKPTKERSGLGNKLNRARLMSTTCLLYSLTTVTSNHVISSVTHVRSLWGISQRSPKQFQQKSSFLASACFSFGTSDLGTRRRLRHRNERKNPESLLKLYCSRCSSSSYRNSNVGPNASFSKQRSRRNNVCFRGDSNTKRYSTHDTQNNADAPDVASRVSSKDLTYMRMALNCANNGWGYTYPNPAVGCVLVRHVQDKADVVIGAGFHPKAGMPHAEVFALFEACDALNGLTKNEGTVSGVDAAKSVMEVSPVDNKDSKKNDLATRVEKLLQIYASKEGPEQLFSNSLQATSTSNVTAYVTLEPCCHYGKTPPCAYSLLCAGVSRVVVGHRDANPRVDGGGIGLLRGAGVTVDVLDTNGEYADEADVAKQCSDIVECFVKRITRPSAAGKEVLDTSMTGAHRSALRSVAGRLKREGIMEERALTPAMTVPKGDNDNASGEKARSIFQSIKPSWFEDVDRALWEKELVLLRLGGGQQKEGVVRKKKEALALGELVAEELQAHVAQVVGHTVLLYRAGSPPELDLDALVERKQQTTAQVDGNGL